MQCGVRTRAYIIGRLCSSGEASGPVLLPYYTCTQSHCHISMAERRLACPCCAHLAKKLLRHIHLLHFGTAGLTSLKCNLDGCQRTFINFTVFRNHVYQFHSDGQLQTVPATDTLNPSSGHCGDPSDISDPKIDSLSTSEDDTSVDQIAAALYINSASTELREPKRTFIIS